ncbi:ROK family protein [Roseibium album]|uniref:ROK family protein n=1 Tax=Roseibium album TaxID=311410 RepID=UPI00391C527F
MSRRIAMGADVGGTKIAIVAVDLQDGRVLFREEIPTLRERGGRDTLDRLLALVSRTTERLIAQGTRPVGLGVGVPELVNNSGIIKSNWNFDWDQRDIAAELSEICPARLESDARTVALAEAEIGHGKKYPSFVFVTVGSGLSCSFCQDGKIHRGANGYAIHFASSDILAVCSSCGAQEGFNLEALASGRGLTETCLARTGCEITPPGLMLNEATQDQKELLDQATSALGSYLAQLINIFDPHALIVGGGLGTNPRFFKMLCERTRPHIWAQDCQHMPILTSAIPKDNAAIGAALLLR